MKKWTRIGLAGGIATAIFGSLLFSKRPPDPIARGRPASSWVLDLLSSDYKVRGEAHAALLQLGSAGVPQIRLLLQRTNPRWQNQIRPFATFLPFLQPSGPDAGKFLQAAVQP